MLASTTMPDQVGAWSAAIATLASERPLQGIAVAAQVLGRPEPSAQRAALEALREISSRHSGNAEVANAIRTAIQQELDTAEDQVRADALRTALEDFEGP